LQNNPPENVYSAILLATFTELVPKMYGALFAVEPASLQPAPSETTVRAVAAEPGAAEVFKVILSTLENDVQGYTVTIKDVVDPWTAGTVTVLLNFLF
jgi:membrane-associated protease RseP (regulator of RpoE activity)